MALTKVRAEVADLTKKKQSPWASTNLTGLFYMNQQASAEPAKAAAAPEKGRHRRAGSAPVSGGNAVELEFWRSVKESNKPEELNAYLTRYPDGAFSGIARARIAALNDPKAPGVALDLARADRDRSGHQDGRSQQQDRRRHRS